MGRRSSIDGLPATERLALKKHLRESSYGTLDAVQEWLWKRGFQVSRSAIGRYSKRLREEDEALMVDTEVILAASPSVLGLWEELGRLKAREREVLQALKQAMRDAANTASGTASTVERGQQ